MSMWKCFIYVLGCRLQPDRKDLGFIGVKTMERAKDMKYRANLFGVAIQLISSVQRSKGNVNWALWG